MEIHETMTCVGSEIFVVGGKVWKSVLLDSILWVTAVEFGIVSFVLHFLFEIVFRINFSTFLFLR